MDIMALAGGTGLDLMRMKKMLRKGIQEEGMLAAGDAAPLEISLGAVQADTLMMRNGVNAPQDDTKNYAKTSLEGMQAASVQQSRQDAILNAGLNQAGSGTSYAAKTMAGQKAAKAMMQDMQRTVQEEAEKILEENRHELDAAAEKAMQPEEAAATGPVADDAALPAPEASESAAAPVGETVDISAAAPVGETVDIIV